MDWISLSFVNGYAKILEKGVTGYSNQDRFDDFGRRREHNGKDKGNLFYE